MNEEPRARDAGSGEPELVLDFDFNRAASDKLFYARALLADEIPSGDIGKVFERALDELIRVLERPRPSLSARGHRGHRRRRA